MSTRLRIRVSDPTRADYQTPAPGKMRNRWGYYRPGYPVSFDNGIGVYLGLVPIPKGPEGADARDFARAYGRDCYVAIRTALGWERCETPANSISPPDGENRCAGSVPPPGVILVRL